MADPIKRPLAWSKSYPAYAEKFEMYGVFQELLKDLIIMKPLDPLEYIKNEISNVARLLHAPRMFLVGPNVVTQGIGRHVAQKIGAKFLTLDEIVESAPGSVKEVLTVCIAEPEKRWDENVRRLLVSVIKMRLTRPDCLKNGFILYGFPQNRAQAKTAQQNGLLARQIYVFLPGDPSNPTFNTVTGDTGTKSTSTGPSTSSGKTTSSGGLKGDHDHHDLNITASQANFREMDIAQLKEVAETYGREICRMIPYEKWSSVKKKDIEDELIANIV